MLKWEKVSFDKILHSLNLNPPKHLIFYPLFISSFIFSSPFSYHFFQFGDVDAGDKIFHPTFYAIYCIPLTLFFFCNPYTMDFILLITFSLLNFIHNFD